MDYTPIIEKVKKTNFLSKFKLMDKKGRTIGYYRIDSVEGDCEDCVYVCLITEASIKLRTTEVLHNYNNNPKFNNMIFDLECFLNCVGVKSLSIVVKNNLVKKSFFRKLVELLTPTI